MAESVRVAPKAAHTCGQCVENRTQPRFVEAEEISMADEGVFELGDARRKVVVRCERPDAALLPMLTFDEVRESYFFRVAFSAQETDDTSRERAPSASPAAPPVLRLSFELVDRP